MIDFACTCGFAFSMPSDQAGTELQCPSCHRLVDVPTLSELPGIQADGTYVIDRDTTDQHVAQGRFSAFVHAFGREDLDDQGFEKDLRPTHDDLDKVSLPATDDSGRPRIAPPKYDPETGELILPLELAATPVRPVRSLPEVYNGPLLSYAAQVRTAGALDWKRVWLELFTPPNMIVMIFPFVCHAFMQVCLLTVRMLIPLGPLFIIGLVLMAHYGAIPAAIGGDDRDELPRPLGNLNFGEDLWQPFYFFAGSLMICYLPALAFFVRLGVTPEGVFLGGTFAGAGTIAFPAVLLTLCTSGTALNLRPDRVLGTIRMCGGYYIASVLEWIAVLILYGGGVVALHIVTVLTFFGSLKWVWFAAGVFALLIGIYSMHLFLWHLGLLYRGKGPAFPWIFQHQMKPVKPMREDPQQRRAKARRRYMGQA